jgi:hypothetical protein
MQTPCQQTLAAAISGQTVAVLLKGDKGHKSGRPMVFNVTQGFINQPND